MSRKFRRRRRNPMCNNFLLIFILFLILLILIQRIRIDHLLDDDGEDCGSVDSTERVEVMIQKTQQDNEVLDNTEQTSSNDTTDSQTLPETSVGTLIPEIEEKVALTAAKEIRFSANIETIKAQCVLARTALYDAEKNGTSAPDMLNQNDTKNLWGADWEKNLNLFESCAGDTYGQVLTYDGNYIYAAYHAISSGATRSMSEMYPDTDMPYLKKISCESDASADGYLAVCYWDKSEFLEQCAGLVPNINLTSPSEVYVAKRDSADYVLTVQIGSASVSGEEFRSAFSLNSACFMITELDNHVRIVTKGIGHGFGMSQTAANNLARSKASYQELLQTFFPDTQLVLLE